MSQQQQTSDTVDNLMQDGRNLLNKVNRRHVVVRNQDGSTLADVTMSTVAIIVLLVFVLQPIGTIAAIAAIAYGLVRKVKIEIIHELASNEKTIDVNLPQE